MPNGRFLGLPFSRNGSKRAAESSAGEVSDAEQGVEHATPSSGPPGAGQVAYSSLAANEANEHSGRDIQLEDVPLQEEHEAPETALQSEPPQASPEEDDPARGSSSRAPPQESPQQQRPASSPAVVADEEVRRAHTGGSSRQQLLAARDAQGPVAREDAATKAAAAASKAAWRQFFTILGGSLLGVFAASTGVSMAVTVLADAPRPTSTTTTTTTFTSTTTHSNSLSQHVDVQVVGPGAATSSPTTAAALAATTKTRTTTTQTSTTLTTATTITTTTITTTRTFTGIDYLPSLFCFTATQDFGDELDLLRIQLAQRRGIFACNDWQVFSMNEVWLSPGVYKTIAVSGPPSRSLPVPGHPELKKFLNTAYFMRMWDVIRDQGLARRTEWTVKADADAMFFPIRLRQYIKFHTLSSAEQLYVLNCQAYNSLLGSLEVFSRAAAEVFADGREHCMQHLDWEHVPEDQFTQQCLALLKVKGIPGWTMVQDARCGGTPAVQCVGEHTVAYHPFKDVGAQFACMEALKNSNGVSPKSIQA